MIKKLFVSCPMQNRDTYEVHGIFDRIREKVQLLYAEDEIKLIDQYSIKDDPSWKDLDPRALRWNRLARSISLMGTADIIVFCDTYEEAPGCISEFTVCKEYAREYPNKYEYMLEEDLDKLIKAKN